MCNRIVSFFLLLSMLLSLFYVTAFAAETSGTCGENLSWSFDPDEGLLTIAGTGAMYDFTTYDPNGVFPPWQDHREEIRSIELCEGVTTIGAHAFFEYTELQRVAFPETLTQVSSGAFYHCVNLTSVVFPDSITSVDSSAFLECVSLSSISIPDKVVSIGIMAFAGTAYIKDPANQEDGLVYAGKHLIGTQSVSGDRVIRDGTLTIASTAFGNCAELTGITIPDSVVLLGNSAFNGCNNLTKVVLSNSLTDIPTGAFMYCTSLKRIFIPASIECIDRQAFGYCYALTDVYFYGDAPEADDMTFYPAKPTVHYIEGKANWTSPEWYGYPTAVWDGIHYAPFDDVQTTDWFCAPVLWAVEQNITKGMTASTFAPNEPCTRGQIVTFLWRACGSPEPTETETSFTDLNPSAFYYKAVLWAVENGITSGTSATTFSPGASCTRGQVATFLWRTKGKPAPTTASNPFGDVIGGTFYYNAVLWAVENGITNGMGNGKFSPNDPCTRGQIVTFLYRALCEDAE